MAPGDFKPIGLEDRVLFKEIFAQDPPQTSELTFTNLFVWRHRYRPEWSLWQDCLLIIFRPEKEAPFGIPPVGPGDKERALERLCDALGSMAPEVRICRVGEGFVDTFVDPDRYDVTYDRDNSDYVYLVQDLIRLSGNKYHRKKNHLNRFLKNYEFEYRSLDSKLVESFLEMQEAWCRIRECAENPALLSEDHAVYEALTRFGELDFQGGAVVIEGKVEAFSLGEPLNQETAVIHVEKANPEIQGLYAAINQMFCKNAWADMTYVNREQDLGVEGLRKAKESYHPHHLVKKYTIMPK